MHFKTSETLVARREEWLHIPRWGQSWLLQGWNAACGFQTSCKLAIRHWGLWIWASKWPHVSEQWVQLPSSQKVSAERKGMSQMDTGGEGMMGWRWPGQRPPWAAFWLVPHQVLWVAHRESAIRWCKGVLYLSFSWLACWNTWWGWGWVGNQDGALGP